MKKLMCILLCLALLTGLLAGCSTGDQQQAYEPTGSELEEETPTAPEDAEDADAQRFSLAYYEETSMNPLIADDFTNRVIISLMYQGLFAVNRKNEVLPILCKGYTASPDLLTYEFTVDPMATFSDGVPVTAEDVVASLETAKNNKYYGGRLRYVSSISVTETGAVRIRLTQPYGNLPMLLDIPIVKAEQVEAENPLGTGPYQLSGWGRERSLTRREGWWCKSEDLQVSANKIPLISADSPTSIRDAFEFYDVGVVCTDPGSDKYVEYRCDYELWECETGIFLYLGVNAKSSAFQNQAVRQALSKGIDRDYLIDKYYRGFATSAELPASPNSAFYTAPLAQHYGYDQVEFLNAMSSMKGRTITLVVNSSDSLRVRVAQEIGRMLNTCGLIVEVKQYSSGNYAAVLREGNYDLYLGQTKLSANMDLSPFFSANGALNYGGIDDIGVYTLCLQALENQGNYYSLHQKVMEDGYLCPILFRSYAVFASRGQLTDLQPARDNVFCYSIGKTLEDAYIVQGL